jgi:RNA polymerase sigma factor (sigma-70 family)
MEILLARMMSAKNSSSSGIAPPQAALRYGSRRNRHFGEASRCAGNRDRRKRYQASGYTSWIPVPPERTTTMNRERVAAAYDAHYDVMRYIAAQRFRVPLADVRPLIHDVFVAYIRHEATIAADRAWLVKATTNACLNYWRDRKCGEPLPEIEDARELADVSARIDLLRLLARVPKRCQAVLWLRYVDGLSPEEIAQSCATKTSSGSYGRLLVHRCLRAVRDALAHPTHRGSP